MSFEIWDAIALAAKAHEGQFDRGRPTVPYITHPMRVMSRFDDPSLQMIAVLHDSIEDSEGRVTLQTLLTLGGPRRVIDGVVALTHRRGESNPEYWARVRTNPDALAVKLADINDNTDPERLRLLPPETARRLRTKYDEAIAHLVPKRQIA